MNEFDLIERYFNALSQQGHPVELGIGDDCALVTLPKPEQRLAISSDTLVAGRHFLPDADAYDVGFKALAVNLSDLAAMGAEPAWYSLCLTLPAADADWLAGFSAGLAAAAAPAPIRLIGGDTTRGPLTVSIHVMGLLEPGQGLTRAGAQAGDRIYVSGALGAAGLGLDLAQNNPHCTQDFQRSALERYLRPIPRTDLGRGLVSLATSCVDVSDGLLGDLTHILTRSGKGAVIDLATIPLADGLSPDQPQAVQFALNAGDDYELCFTAPPSAAAAIETLAATLALPLTPIGWITDHPGLELQGKGGAQIRLASYQHFNA